MSVLIDAIRAAKERGEFNPETREVKPMSETTHNHDIKSLVTSIDQINEEINNSASTQITGVTTEDLTRWKSYIGALRTYRDWVIGEPGNPLDMPKTNKMLLEIPDMPEVVATNNGCADDLVRMLGLERTELVHCQSSGLSSGLISYDSARFTAVLDKCDSRIALAESGAPVYDAPWTLPTIGDAVTASSRGVNLP